MADTSGTEVERSGPRADGLLESALGVITEPVPTLHRLTHEPRVAWAVVITIVLALASALAGAAQFESLPPGVDPSFFQRDFRDAALPVALIGGPLLALLALVIAAGIVQASSYMLGGRGPYSGMFVGLAFANIPSIFDIPAQLLSLAFGRPGAVIAGIVGFVTSIWVVVLAVIAIRENHGFSTGRAVAAALIPLVLIILLVVVLFVAVAVQVGRVS